MTTDTASNPTEILNAARREGRELLLEHEAYAVLAACGVATPRHLFAAAGDRIDDAALSRLGGSEVIVKIVSPDVTHKSDFGGVLRVARQADSVKRAIAGMMETVAARAEGADLRGVLVAERVEFQADVPGSEYLVSVRRDPAFGPILLIGLGGLLAEWYGKISDVHTRVLVPANDLDVEEALAAIEATPLGAIALHPSRIHERPPLERSQLAGVLTALARLATTEFATTGFPEGGIDDRAAPPIRIEEVELNPLVATGGRPMALDALMRIGSPAAPSRPPRPVRKIGHLLHPRSAAVIGASNRAENAGRIILNNLRTSTGLDYGHLYVVHPRAESIDGVRAFGSIADLPEMVDLAVVSVPAQAARDSIRDLIEHQKARSIILIPGGFAETGEAELAGEITSALAGSRSGPDGGPVMVGGNCLGIVSKGEYNTFFLPTYKLPFHDAPGENLVAVSQSGAYLVSFTSNLDGIIFPRASISYGNEMDLSAADFLEYYLEHEREARTFAFYVEGFPAGEGERFVRLVREATGRGSPVVIYKAGRTVHGARAAASHTASMAGDYEVAEAALTAAGALVTSTLNMFEDYTKLFAMLDGVRVHDRRLGVITNAGFEAGAVADHLYTLEPAVFSERTVAELDRILPAIAHTGNPVDATPMADTRLFVAAIECVAADPGVDMVIVSAIPAAPQLDVLAPDLAGAHAENIFAMGSLPAELVRLHRTLEKPMVVAIDSGRLYDPTVLYLQRGGIPVYRKIDRASRALSAFATFHLRQRET